MHPVTLLQHNPRPLACPCRRASGGAIAGGLYLQPAGCAPCVCVHPGVQPRRVCGVRSAEGGGRKAGASCCHMPCFACSLGAAVISTLACMLRYLPSQLASPGAPSTLAAAKQLQGCNAPKLTPATCASMDGAWRQHMLTNWLTSLAARIVHASPLRAAYYSAKSAWLRSATAKQHAGGFSG